MRKIELIRAIEDEKLRAEAIKTLSNDEDKKELLQGISLEANRARIIATLSNDDEREIKQRKTEELEDLSEEELMSTLSYLDTQIEVNYKKIAMINEQKRKVLIEQIKIGRGILAEQQELLEGIEKESQVH